MPQQIDWSKLPDSNEIDLSGLPDQEEQIRNIKPTIPSSTGKGLWSTLTDPIVPRTTQGGVLDALKAIPDVGRGLLEHPKETLGGFAQGAWEGVKSFSPLDMLDVATIPFGGPKLNILKRGIDALVAGKGAQHIGQGDVLTGTAELLGGGAGLASGLRSGSKIINQPKVEVLPPDIPRTPLGLPAKGETTPSTISAVGRPFVAGKAGVASPETDYLAQVVNPHIKQVRGDKGKFTGEVKELSPAIKNIVSPEIAASRESPIIKVGGPKLQTELAIKEEPKIDAPRAPIPETKLGPSAPIFRNSEEASRMWPKLADEMRKDNTTPFHKKREAILNSFRPSFEESVKNATKGDEIVELHGGLGVGPINATITDAMTFNKALMGSADMSAPFRQALPLVYTREFWQNMLPMAKSLGSKRFFDSTMEGINQMPSRKLMDRAGLALTDGLTHNEEAFLSKTAGKLPWVSSANRAFTAFLNKTRADVFERMLKDAQEGQKILGVRVTKPVDINNDKFLQSLGRYINDATGRSTLGKLGEPATNLLNAAFFSPRLIASRVKLLNPYTYVNPNTPRFVRLQYLKSLMGVVAFGTAFTKLAELAGAEVGTNPTSPDFGKIKIGNTRLDPWGGFQQYVVFINQMRQGKYTSSKNNKEYQFNSGNFGGPTYWSNLERFLYSKANPVAGFLKAIMSGKDFTGQPVNVQQETARLFVPLILEDMWELAKSDHPELIPVLTPLVGLGMGSQTYNEGPRNEILTDLLKSAGVMEQDKKSFGRR